MSKSLTGSLAVNVVAAVGIATAWCVAAAWMMALAVATLQQRHGYELLYVTLRGEPVRVRTGLGTGQSIVTLSGQPIDVDTQQLLYLPYIGTGEVYAGMSPGTWSWRLAAVNDNRSPATYWYLIHDGRINGQAYGVGYHSQTHAIVGYFGVRGFSERIPPREEWFAIAGGTALAGVTTNLSLTEPTWNQLPKLYFLSDGKLWSVDPGQRTVTALVDCPGALGLGTSYIAPADPGPTQPPAGVWSGSLAQTTPRWLMIRERQRVLLVDPHSSKTMPYPFPESLRRAQLAGFLLSDQTLLLLAIGSREGKTTQEVLWINDQGSVTKREEVPLPQPATNDPNMMAWLGTAAAPLPLAGALAVASIPRIIQQEGLVETNAEGLAQTLGILWPCLAVVTAIGAVAAVAAWRRQKRFGLPHATGWAAFVFLFGVPGWIAYRVHRTWPVFEECPACRQAAPRDRTECTECGADFPPPVLKGIEVFA
jgi:hypothetical protein